MLVSISNYSVCLEIYILEIIYSPWNFSSFIHTEYIFKSDKEETVKLLQGKFKKISLQDDNQIVEGTGM